MLKNPFKPSQIATDPLDFFGRDKELASIELVLQQSSVAIQGIAGIGKSSLAYQSRLRMEGFLSENCSRCVFAVCYRDIENVDQMARLVLERLVSVDEKSNKVTWKFPWLEVVERESASITKYFSEGRHLQALMRVLEKEHVENFIPKGSYLIISIDEADKNPEVIAAFVRIVLTESQGNGIDNIRFLVSGVQPFFKSMCTADEGILRFFPAPMTLHPLSYDETVELLQTKFAELIAAAELVGESLSIHPAVVERTAELSGGNPSLIQLLGSRIVQNEILNPDGIIDIKDLVEAFNQVCYVDRAEVYRELYELLERNDTFDAFSKIYQAMSDGFPAHISTEAARRITSALDVDWLVENSILRQNGDYYMLVDEMLRVRIAMDSDLRFGSQEEFEEHLTLFTDVDTLPTYSSQDDTAFPPQTWNVDEEEAYDFDDDDDDDDDFDDDFDDDDDDNKSR